MIDNVVFLAGSYAAMAAGLSAVVAKVSPSIGPRLRHLFAGGAPLAAVLGARLAEPIASPCRAWTCSAPEDWWCSAS